MGAGFMVLGFRGLGPRDLGFRDLGFGVRVGGAGGFRAEGLRSRVLGALEASCWANFRVGFRDILRELKPKP